MTYPIPQQQSGPEPSNRTTIIVLNLVYITFLIFYAFIFQIMGEIRLPSSLYMIFVLSVILFPIPVAITLGKAGCALTVLWIILFAVFGVLMLTLSERGGQNMYTLSYTYHLFLLLGTATWMNLINHRLINQEPMSWDREDVKLDDSPLFLYKYQCKSVKMESVLIILAYIYLFITLLIYAIMSVFGWFLSYMILIIVGVYALDMFWYASKYSKNMIIFSGIMGNIILFMLVLSSFGVIAEFGLVLDIIFTNIGFLLLGASTLSLKKTNPLRRALVFNWMAWSLYFTIGLIYSVYIFDTGVFIEFFLGFSEVSLIVGTTYQEAPI